MVFFGKNLNALKYGAKHTFVMCQTQFPNNIYIDKDNKQGFLCPNVAQQKLFSKILAGNSL